MQAWHICVPPHSCRISVGRAQSRQVSSTSVMSVPILLAQVCLQLVRRVSRGRKCCPIGVHVLSCCSGTGPFPGAGAGEWKIPPPPGDRSLRGRFPKGRFTFRRREPSSIHEEEYLSNRVTRYMQRGCTSAAPGSLSGRPDGPLCGIRYVDFGERAFHALR